MKGVCFCFLLLSFFALKHIEGYTWFKIFSHHARGGMFSRNDRTEPNNWNSDDPDSLRYSIIDQIEKYRKNGVFHLRICFPDYTEDEFPCNEFEQSSNFVTETSVSVCLKVPSG